MGDRGKILSPRRSFQPPRQLARHSSRIFFFATKWSQRGGTAEVFVRDPGAIFHGRSARARPLWQRIKAPVTVFGTRRRHWPLQHFPLLVYTLPEARRIRLVQGYLGPASTWWTKDRVLGKVPIYVSCELVEARAAGNRVLIRIRGASNILREAEVDRD